MLLLITGMEFSIVRLFVFEHAKDNFQESLTQAPEATGVTHAFSAFLFVIGLAPGAGLAKAIGPKMHRVAKEFVAGPTHTNFIDLSGLVADRCSSGDALEHFMAAVTLGIVTNGRQEARG